MTLREAAAKERRAGRARWQEPLTGRAGVIAELGLGRLVIVAQGHRVGAGGTLPIAR